jgi:DtxR family Mn-dependent transcriptional regulator
MTGPAPAPDSAHHPPVEEYLETIFHLEEAGIPAMRARLVERLRVSAPAVSEQVKRLEREGYVCLAPDRTIGFTAAGEAYAAAIVRRHRLAERLLVDVLGLPWHQVHEEAGRLEHAISPVLEARLVALLDDPVTCPHGNPIPGSRRRYEPGPMQPLTELAPGRAAQVIRLEENLQADHAVLMALEQAGVVPGATVTVTAADGDTIRLTAPSGPVTVRRSAAGAIRVSR